MLHARTQVADTAYVLTRLPTAHPPLCFSMQYTRDPINMTSSLANISEHFSSSFFLLVCAGMSDFPRLRIRDPCEMTLKADTRLPLLLYYSRYRA